jgi:hypothetical protein
LLNKNGRRTFKIQADRQTDCFPVAGQKRKGQKRKKQLENAFLKMQKCKRNLTEESERSNVLPCTAEKSER